MLLKKSAYNKQIACSDNHLGMCALRQLACNEEIELWHVKQEWIQLYCGNCEYNPDTCLKSHVCPQI